MRWTSKDIERFVNNPHRDKDPTANLNKMDWSDRIYFIVIAVAAAAIIYGLIATLYWDKRAKLVKDEYFNAWYLRVYYPNGYLQRQADGSFYRHDKFTTSALISDSTDAVKIMEQYGRWKKAGH